MVVRSLLTGLMMASAMITSGASAQVLLCPPPPELSADTAEMRADAERLLERLLISLDLNAHEGIDEAKIVDTHAETPGALITKLSNVADRCSLAASSEPKDFYEQLPDLRRQFLEAAWVGETSELKTDASSGHLIVDSGRYPAFAELAEAVQSAPPTDLSVRALWRKLWFRTPSENDRQEDRWAVIVASPEGAEKGWETLGEHLVTWDDVYFQLHQPYYEGSDYHAIVVGRKLPRNEAEKLLDYVIEMGMADDSYLWQVPVDEAVDETVDIASTGITVEEVDLDFTGNLLDLSVLDK